MGVNKQKLVKSGIWQFSNTIVVILSQIVANAIIARYVTKKEFGIMAITNAFINFASFFSEAGMGDALMQRRELEQEHKNAALFFSVGLSTVIYVVLFTLSPYIAEFYGDPILIPVLRVLGLSFIFLSLGSSSFNLLQKNFRFKHVFFSDSLSLFLSNVLGVVLAMKGYGVWSLVYSILFYNVGRLIMVWILEPIPLRMGAKLKHWKDLFNYGMGLTLIRIYNFMSGFGIMLLIGKVVPIQTLGTFERSYRISNIPVRYLGDMIQKVMMPFMVKINDEKEKLFNFFYRSLTFSNALLFPISVFLLVFCKPIVLILLGSKWKDAVLPMQILFLSVPFRITTKVSDVLMRATNLVFKNANRKLQYVIVLFVSVFFASYWGITGIAIAVTGSAVFSYVSMLFTIKRRLFAEGWKKLMFRPFSNGLMLAVFFVTPSYFLYQGILEISNKNELLSFTLLCIIIGALAAFAFFRKPRLLGADFVMLKNELTKMVKNKGKKGGGRGKKGRMAKQQDDLPQLTE